MNRLILQYTKYLQSQPQKDLVKIREIYRRACVVHHPSKPWINLHWAAFEESQGMLMFEQTSGCIVA